MDREAGFDPTKMPYSAANLRVGHHVRLFAIDEDAEEESIRFVAMVADMSPSPTPIAHFGADFGGRDEAPQLGEILRSVLEAREAHLHIELVGRHGPYVEAVSPPIVIGLMDPGLGDENLALHIDSMSGFEAGDGCQLAFSGTFQV